MYLGFDVDDVIDAIKRARSLDELWKIIGNPTSLIDASED
jgi:hypothetical protein